MRNKTLIPLLDIFGCINRKNLCAFVNEKFLKIIYCVKENLISKNFKNYSYIRKV